MLLDHCEESAPSAELIPHYGQAAKGDSRWPRWDLECPIARLLLKGNSVSLFGLRRIGKSSLMLGIDELVRREGAQPVTLELQGANRIETLVGRLIQACEQQADRSLADGIRGLFTDAALKLPSRVRQVLQLWTCGPSKDQERHAGPKDVLEYLEAILGPISERLRRHDRKIVLILDELPFFCQELHDQGDTDSRHVAAFLTELRRWRDAGLAMLIAGSIGVHRLERNLGVDPNLFGDLNHERLPPLAKVDAEAMIAALARGCRFDFWTPEDTKAVLTAPPAAYPTFFQAIFLDLQRAARGRGLTPEVISGLAAETTERLLQQNFFPQFDNRLRYYAREEANVAMGMFRRFGDPEEIPATALAEVFPQDWTLVQKTALLTALIQDDFLAKRPGNHFGFATPLAAVWWAERDALNG